MKTTSLVGASTALFAGGGIRLPWESDNQPAWLVAGWEGRRFAEDAAPVAGSEALTRIDRLFVQLRVRLRAMPTLTEPAG